MISDTLAGGAGSAYVYEASYLQLARLAAQGDEVAAAQWVARVSPPLLRTATVILQDPHLAEDALQETLVAALKAVHRYDGRAPLMSWLMTILVNRCRTFHRSPKNRPWPAHESLSWVPDSRDDVGDAVRRDAMRQALLKLSVGYRTVLVLHYFEDLPIDEIARITERPVGTVKSQLHRARRRLKQLLVKGGLTHADG